MSPRRIVIYPKDIAMMTGRTERTARRILAQVRKAYGKKSRDFVTVSEFCSFAGFAEDEVLEMLR
ncbi:hypothetical protein FW415_21540 [Chitinophaga sp. XS-30]|nr:hypothetical protein FW415_21540 [Chitinophaga sp. XS-30]